MKTLERNIEFANRLYGSKVEIGSEYIYPKTIQFNLNNFSIVGNDKIIDKYFLQNNEAINVSRLEGFGESYDHIAAEMEQEYKDGVEDGLEQGIKQGIEQGRIETAKRMFKSGVKKEIIAKYTEIEVKRLDEILN